MNIVEIKKDKKHTVKVSFSGGKAFNFDLDYWKELCLNKNDEISEDTLKFHLNTLTHIKPAVLHAAGFFVYSFCLFICK